MHARTKQIADLLDHLGIEVEVRVFEADTRTAVAAAQQLGCEVGAIANSLVFDSDGEALLVMTSGAHRVDTAHLAHLLGARTIKRAAPDLVRSATGQVIGGVAPIGHPAPIRTIIDPTLASYPRIWMAAGTPDSVMSMSYADLVAVTRGTELPVN